MIYTLDQTPFPPVPWYPLLPWKNIFYTLSIQQFRQLYDKLDFPFVPSEAVRQIAHDFCFTHELLLAIPEYSKKMLANLLYNNESISVNLLEGATPDASYQRICDLLFTNTFSHLDHLGCAEAVYQWGKTTHDY